ncbi:MAG: metal-dependent hydrolase, partial [Pseudomonadota bacterium]
SGTKGRPAIVALTACAAFIAANIGISALAWRAPEREIPYTQPDRIFAAPDALRFWQRDVVWRSDGMITHARFDPFESVTRVTDRSLPVADNMAVPVVQRAAQATSDVQDFLAWSQLPVARTQRRGCDVTVIFG